MFKFYTDLRLDAEALSVCHSQVSRACAILPLVLHSMRSSGLAGRCGPTEASCTQYAPASCCAGGSCICSAPSPDVHGSCTPCQPVLRTNRRPAPSQGLEPALALVGLAGKRLTPGDPDKSVARPPAIPWWDDLR